jgi:Flp pilus assembly protein TadD
VALARALGLIPTDPAQEPDLTTVQRRLGWNEWERLQLEEQLLERSRHAPFTDQLGHDAAVAAQEHQVEALSEHVARHSTPSLEQVYRTALEARPSDWMVREHLARFLQSRGSHRAAIQALRGVQEQLPHHDEIPVMLGVSLAQVGEGDAARVAFEEALQLNPEHGLAHFNLGRLLHAGGDLLTAEAHYRRALLLRPSLGEIPYQLGRLLGETGRRAEAIVQLEHALDLGPGRPDVELALAMELWRSGRPDDAARHLMTLERAARRRGDPGTAAQLGTLLERVQAGQAAPAPGD